MGKTPYFGPPLLRLLVFACGILAVSSKIDRKSIVRRYNPVRYASSTTTPMQVGTGNFAFGADITGLQTFQPFSIMSSWGWKNDTLPPGKTQQDILDYRGAVWPSHGRPIQYMFDGEPTMNFWMISNPNRVNLGRVGLVFLSESDAGQSQPREFEVTEEDIHNAEQTLDLWTGTLISRFTFQDIQIEVVTRAAPDEATVAIEITSKLLDKGRLAVFLDFPWNDGKSKFKAPFVGVYNATSEHSTRLLPRRGGEKSAGIEHDLDGTVFKTIVRSKELFDIWRNSEDNHRYTVLPERQADRFAFTLSYSSPSFPQPQEPRGLSVTEVQAASTRAWSDFWTRSGFVDVFTGSSDPRADELQRRIILSRYLLRVNEYGDSPPQESGLVNNGWYGKFHMEMIFWHWAHWSLWSQPSPALSVYKRFLPTSLERAQVQQGYTRFNGARWSKMTDYIGRSAPGQINELLIWQQPHPLVFAEYEYRLNPTLETLSGWKEIVRATADWMAEFAWYNEISGLYDLGPPMMVVSEDTPPNSTRNAAFELAYWRLGLGLAETWFERLGERPPRRWGDVRTKLAPLPLAIPVGEEAELYAIYEGISPTFWTDSAYTNDHPALTGLLGWLPPTTGLNLSIAANTAKKTWGSWNITNCWGWDFPMLAMSAARIGQHEKAIEWLLHPLFEFDDIGMPVGGVRVPTPYFPGSGGLLYAIAMMAEGWDGSKSHAPGFPKVGWKIGTEGIRKAL